MTASLLDSLTSISLDAYDNHDENAAARTSFLAYLARVIRDKRGAPLPVDAYTKVMADTLECCRAANLHLNHLAPTGVGKTTIARGFVTREIGLDTATTAVAVSAGDRVSKNSVSLCRQIVMTPKYRAVFPEAIPDYERSRMADGRGWKQDEFYFRAEGEGQQQDPTLAAVPAIPQSESRRIDIGLFDDYVTLAIASMAGGLAKYRDAFFNTWLEGRMKNGGWAILLHNCIRNDDLPHSLRSDPRVCSFWFGVTLDCERAFARFWNPPPDLGIISDPGAFEAEPTDPQDGADYEFILPLPRRDGWKPEDLRAMTESVRRRNMHLIPLAPDDLMFPSWHKRRIERGRSVARCLGLQENPSTGLPTMSAMDRMRLTVAAGIDVSSLSRKGCVLFVVARDPQGIIWPMAVWIGAYRMEDFADKLDLLWEHGIQPNVINFENNAAQDQMSESLRAEGARRRAEWAGRLAAFMTGRNKADPMAGLPALETEMANGRIMFPDEGARGLPHCAPWLVWQNQMAECPRFLKPGETPDAIMAFWFARNGIRDRAVIPDSVRSRAVRIRPAGASGQF